MCGFKPPLCTYRLNRHRRTSWGWWDEWDYTVLQTQDSGLEPWRSEAEHATSRSWRFPAILIHHDCSGKKHFLRVEGQSGVRSWNLRLSKQAALATATGPQPHITKKDIIYWHQIVPLTFPQQCKFAWKVGLSTVSSMQLSLVNYHDINVLSLAERSQGCGTEVR